MEPADLRPPPPGLWAFSRAVTITWFSVLHGVEVVGRRHCPPAGPLVVVSNHPTYWDPFLVGLGLLRYVYWMAWDDIFEWPLAGPLVRAFRAFPVDLERPKPSSLRAARAVLERGLPLGVFPEGGRSSGPGLDPFKPGAARLALAAGARILPVSIRGAHAAWPKPRAYPLPGPKIVVTYHEAFDPAELAPAGRPPREREALVLRHLERTIASAL